MTPKISLRFGVIYHFSFLKESRLLLNYVERFLD